MSLNLDARQRAMLQEMGVTLWWPQTTAAVAAPAASVAVVPAPVPAPVAQRVTIAPPAPAPAAAPVPPPAPPAPRPVVAAPAIVTTPPAPAVETDWRMAPAVQAFPQATGGSAEDGWLVIWESPSPATPLDSDAGKLLHNMLRALRLHHSAHVWLAGMQRPGHEALPALGLPQAPVDWQALPTGLHANVQRVRPARILLLGLHPARAVLGSTEALGRLRAQVHEVCQIPTIVSYDPAYLLRAPHAKPAAWADLCRAHALRPPSAN